MKIMIVSDTHRKVTNLEKALEINGHIDMLIHLGDVEGNEEYIRKIANAPVHMVSGNNDFFSRLPKEEELQIGKYRVLLTHGHYYYVSVDNNTIKKEAAARNKDIVMFGHTHRPSVEYDAERKITAINPGSLSYPRQEGRRPSYIMMEIDREGEAHYTIHYL